MIQILQSHHNMEMCRWFFKVWLKFKMAATDQFQFFWGRKNSKNDHIPHDMATACRLFKYLWPQKTLT